MGAHWVGTWGCAMYHGDDSGDAGKASALAVSKTLRGATLRQIVRVTLGGDILRFTFTNEYGQTNLCIPEARIAKALISAQSDIEPETDTLVTWNGRRDVVIPPGGRAVSDDVAFKVNPLERLAVSVYFEDIPGCVDCHVGARANSFISHGNVVSAYVMEGAAVNTHWFALSNVDVSAASGCSSVVVLGDSITDGYGVADEQYTRWTDVLAGRLMSGGGMSGGGMSGGGMSGGGITGGGISGGGMSGGGITGNDRDKRDMTSSCDAVRGLSVINMGIGTNCLLGQKNPPAALTRFERDVLKQAGAGHFMFLIGVNDLCAGTPAEQIIKGYEEMITAARAAGIRTYGCTIMPYDRGDGRRHTVNNWLRNGYKDGRLDGLVDFDMLLQDPGNPERLRAEYNCDGLHPTPAAYRVMGEHAYSFFCEKLRCFCEN